MLQIIASILPLLALTNISSKNLFVLFFMETFIILLLGFVIDYYGYELMLITLNGASVVIHGIMIAIMIVYVLINNARRRRDRKANEMQQNISYIYDPVKLLMFRNLHKD